MSRMVRGASARQAAGRTGHTVRRLIHPRRSATALIAGLAVVVIAAGGAYGATSGVLSAAHAASRGHSQRIYACVTARFDTLNLSSARAACPAGQRKISWNADGPRGPRGLIGATGTAGTHGTNGATGNQGTGGTDGAQGTAGAQGATGAQGPAGAQGAVGATGLTGPAGTLSSAYLDAYTAVALPVVVAGSDVPFPTQTETPVGITANSANTIFTATSAGTYFVTVRLVNDSGSGPFYFATQVNGAAVGPDDVLQSGAGATVNWTRIINVTAGGTIAINTTTGATLDADSEITIIRIA